MIKNGTKILAYAIDEYPEIEGVIVGSFTVDGNVIYDIKTSECAEDELYDLQLTSNSFEVINPRMINLTPHTIILNDGTEYPSEGIARVNNTFSEFNGNKICRVSYNKVEGLPEPKENTIYIVSSIVLNAAHKEGRYDVVSPATGHPECIRENGFIKSVPGFIC